MNTEMEMSNMVLNNLENVIVVINIIVTFINV